MAVGRDGSTAVSQSPFLARDEFAVAGSLVVVTTDWAAAEAALARFSSDRTGACLRQFVGDAFSGDGKALDRLDLDQSAVPAAGDEAVAVAVKVSYTAKATELNVFFDSPWSGTAGPWPCCWSA